MDDTPLPRYSLGAGMGRGIGHHGGFLICGHPTLPAFMPSSATYTRVWTGCRIGLHLPYHAVCLQSGPLGMVFSVPQQQEMALSPLQSCSGGYLGPGGHLPKSHPSTVRLRKTADRGELPIHRLSLTTSIPGSATTCRHSPTLGL